MPEAGLGGKPAPSPAAVPDNRAYLTALASLVPSEVIAVHTAYANQLRGKFEENQKKREADISAAKNGNAAALQQVKVHDAPLEARKLFDASDAFALQVLFWGGILVTILLYLWGRGKVSLREFGLSLIPATAYVVWMMLQPASAFDAVFSLAGAERGIIAVLLAVVLIQVSARLQKS